MKQHATTHYRMHAHCQVQQIIGEREEKAACTENVAELNSMQNNAQTLPDAFGAVTFSFTTVGWGATAAGGGVVGRAAAATTTTTGFSAAATTGGAAAAAVGFAATTGGAAMASFLASTPETLGFAAPGGAILDFAGTGGVTKAGGAAAATGGAAAAGFLAAATVGFATGGCLGLEVREINK